jgi:hypothetical protein
MPDVTRDNGMRSVPLAGTTVTSPRPAVEDAAAGEGVAGAEVTAKAGAANRRAAAATNAANHRDRPLSREAETVVKA